MPILIGIFLFVKSYGSCEVSVDISQNITYVIDLNGTHSMKPAYRGWLYCADFSVI